MVEALGSQPARVWVQISYLVGDDCENELLALILPPPTNLWTNK